MKKLASRKIALVAAIILFYIAAQFAGSYAIRQMFLHQVIVDLTPQAKAIAEQYIAGTPRERARQPYIIKILDVFGNPVDIKSGDGDKDDAKENSADQALVAALKKDLPAVAAGDEYSGIESVPGLPNQSIVIGEPVVRDSIVVAAVFLLKPASDYQAVLNAFTVVFAVTMLLGVLLFSVFLKLYFDESKRLEAIRREYVANVSHELKSPISSIKALTETLSDGLAQDEETRQRYYGIILSESSRLEKLTAEILELSRLQSGKTVIVKQKTDPKKLMLAVRDEYAVRADELGIAFSVSDAALDLPPLLTSEDRIVQILHILLNNAFKFVGENGSVSVDAEIARTQVRLFVRDNGAGIAKDVLPYVFDRFYKEDKAHNSGGSGLGLSIAKELLTDMGESIQVKSEPGKGSEFSFTIRRCRDAIT
jgi:signal transduction histidine kinase